MLNFLYRWLTFHVFLQVAEYFYNDRIMGQAGRKIGESVGSISRGPTPELNGSLVYLYSSLNIHYDTLEENSSGNIAHGIFFFVFSLLWPRVNPSFFETIIPSSGLLFQAGLQQQLSPPDNAHISIVCFLSGGCGSSLLLRPVPAFFNLIRSRS